ncbi:biotin/lipoyl-binding protein [Sphingomonas sp. Ant20]|uniref:biotin/lipoyl-binding protein n=1 Tax=Sphingomonas sp. Ant20 TaxID=104605 RepID=UPI000A817751
MTDMTKKWLVRIAVIVAIAVVAFIGWRLLKPKGLPEGIVSGNGRIEAVEVDVSAKSPGRIADILVGEGDFVKAGQVVAHMDVAPLRAERAQAVAQLAQAANGIDIASNTIAQRESDRAAAAAVVQQRLAELNAAHKRLQRSETLRARARPRCRSATTTRRRWRVPVRRLAPRARSLPPPARR